jgi:putative addiction module antidote
MKKAKLRRAGGSLVVTLPAEMVERLGLQDGDPVWAVDHERGILLIPNDPDFDVTAGLYEAGSRKYRDLLKVLGL